MGVESATKLKRVVPRREARLNADRHEPLSIRFPSIDAIANVAVEPTRVGNDGHAGLCVRSA